MKLRLFEQMERHARDNPRADAVCDESGQAISRGELLARVRCWSAYLAATVPAGGVVMICTPNRSEFTIAFLAVLSAGLRAFPVSPELTGPELLSALDQPRAELLIGTPSVVREFGHVKGILIDDISRAPEATAAFERPHDTSGLLLLSSGTMGRPKIVFRDCHSLDAVSDAMVESIDFSDFDRVLACVPLCHSYGIEHGLLAPLYAGSCAQLHNGFELRAVLRDLIDRRITIFPGVPFMFEILAHRGRPVSSLRRVYSAGGPLPNSVALAFKDTFGIPLSQLYGATEIGSVTYSNPDLAGFNPASVGRAMKGVSIRILDPDPSGQGHIAIRAASMLHSYLGDVTPPLADGFFHTGDQGRIDESGNLVLTGRIKLLIDVGGLKVNPLEVEDVLMQHPTVASCVVVPVQASETVCRVKAIVTPHEEHAPPQPEVLRKFARQHLAGYKVPRLIEIRASLPKSPTGKILRHQVQA